MADFFSSYLLPTSPPPGASLAPSGLEGEGGELAADTQDTASPAGGWIDEFSFMEGALLARAARGSLAPLSSSGPSWQREVDAAGAPAATAAPKPAAPVPKEATRGLCSWSCGGWYCYLCRSMASAAPGIR